MITRLNLAVMRGSKMVSAADESGPSIATVQAAINYKSTRGVGIRLMASKKVTRTKQTLKFVLNRAVGITLYGKFEKILKRLYMLVNKRKLFILSIIVIKYVSWSWNFVHCHFAVNCMV